MSSPGGASDRVIRVLVADDSLTVRALLVEIIESDPGMRVVGQAKNGAEAVALARRLRPDVITMDVHMPGTDGIEATKQIMIDTPLPIVIVSSSTSVRDVNFALDALRFGALMVLEKPDNPRSSAFEARRRHFLSMVRAMAGVKVVRRRMSSPTKSPTPPAANVLPLGSGKRVRLVAMAASTGGPAALQKLLGALPRDFPVPILVVQHMAPGFIGGMATWLAQSCALRVRVAVDGEQLEAGTVYLAADDRQLGVAPGMRSEVVDAAPIGGFRPSGTYLFRSAATRFGSGVVAVILTGMGRDGVEGLETVKRMGGRVIAQDEDSCIVYGMPREALVAGHVHAVLPLERIAAGLVELVADE